ncbi:MAG: MotA/TolQ/ExbB proton channel family protein [Thermogemmata sp.]|nr:MotA/TolQ/ExbB proton channel family protein [Thermogemmata sp.]
MWEAYQQTVAQNPLDLGILIFGFVLILAHIVGLIGRYHGQRRLFVQELDRYRTFCLLLTELLPVLGMLGTVLSLMFTFSSFQTAADEGTPDLSQMVRAFAPAMSTTISGLLMSIPNLLLNGILWLASPPSQEGSAGP